LDVSDLAVCFGFGCRGVRHAGGIPMRPDTRKLLVTGGAIFGVGAVAAALMLTVFGGVSKQGPHTTLGWLALMLAMGCLPTGTLTLLLGGTKALGDRSKS